MTYFIIGVSIYLIWAIIGVWFFLSVMGQKYRKQKWYDWSLILPVMPILHIIGWMNRK
jgi:hypothetical protein